MTAQTHPDEQELPDGEPEAVDRNTAEAPAPVAAASDAGEVPSGDGSAPGSSAAGGHEPEDADRKSVV